MNYKEILIRHGFRYNHSLGQNFITDTNLLDALVSDSGIGGDDIVVEIGTGAGTLTRALAKKAKHVYTFEVDENLRPVLDETLADLKNVTVFFENVMKMSDGEILDRTGKGFTVVANLPYYITTPLVMRFVESDLLDARSLTFTIQKEVAERFCAKKNTPEYGAVTLGIALRGKAEIKRIIDKKLFYPVPKVDSAVITITLFDRYGEKHNKTLKKLIRCAFHMRRKTLANNICGTFGIPRQDAERAIVSAGLAPMVRGESLGMEELILIAKNIDLL